MRKKSMQTLIIDHYDSFTYNLFQLIAEIQGRDPWVMSHDSEELAQLDPNTYDNIILSPGPGHPEHPQDFAISKSMILHSDKPILGVCLGHQGIFTTFGGHIERAPVPMHGRLSTITHHGDALYQHIPPSFRVMRYHSLLCTGPIPAELEITAWTQDGLIMGLRHRSRPIWGIQYHPESIAGDYGRLLLENFTHLSMQYYQHRDLKLPSHPASAFKMPSQAVKPQVVESTIWEMRSQTLAFHGDPTDLFQKLFAHHTTAVWLDSSQIIPGFSRFSYMGAPQGPFAYALTYDTQTRITTKLCNEITTTYAMSIFSYLKQALQEIKIVTPPAIPFDFHGGFIGYLGYELNQETAPIVNAKVSPHPDAQWVFLDRFLVFDHVENLCHLFVITPQDQPDTSELWLQTMRHQLQTCRPYSHTITMPHAVHGTWMQTPETYMTRIQDCLDFIADGESYEICLTNKLQFTQQVDPLQFYRNLRHCHPAPHAAYLKFGELAIACSSMERFLKIDQARMIQAKPIKGTTPRGQSPQEDLAFATALREDEKFYSEHLMIVDLLRNDLGKICQIGSISVPDLMQVETYATVHQLVSRITGHLKPEMNVVDCIQHVFPGGSMTGAPKIRAMTLINQLETQARGIYSGSLGYISLNGAVDLNIVIRTAEITPQQINVGAGGAIIALSDPAEEFAEMVLKTRAVQTALGMTVEQET